MPRYKIIVNPLAGRGHAGRIIPELTAHLDALDLDFDLIQTTAVGDGIHLAREAADDGYDTIVSVGGDGTTNEVVNGLMARANGQPVGTLAAIPAGSGNDFAVMNGMSEELAAACRTLAGGQTRLVDLGLLTMDGAVERYFDNNVGIGFDGLVAKETRKFRFIRGLLLYMVVVLKTILFTLQPIRVRLTCDDREMTLHPLMVVVSNGPREGGGFFVAPGARYDDGYFDVMVADKMPRLVMLGLIPRFLKGTHVDHPKIQIIRARHVVIESEEILHFHVDGEILREEAHRLEMRMVPGMLRMIGSAERA